MTLGQFAVLVGAPRKWVQNALMTLGEPSNYSVAGGQRLRLARLIQETVGSDLARACRVADRCLEDQGNRSAWTVSAPDRSVRLVIDRARFLSSFAVALSASRAWYRERRRGRRSREPLDRQLARRGIDPAALRRTAAMAPAERLERIEETLVEVEEDEERRGPDLPGLIRLLRVRRVEFVLVGEMAAIARGALRMPEALDFCIDPAPINLERLVRILPLIHAELRSVGPGYPVRLDATTFASAEAVPLTTDLGAANVLTSLPGVGAYDAVAAGADLIEALAVDVSVLQSEPLRASLAALGGDVDVEVGLELEAVDMLTATGRGVSPPVASSAS